MLRALLVLFIASACSAAEFSAELVIYGKYAAVCPRATSHANVMCNHLRTTNGNFSYICVIKALDDKDCYDGLCTCPTRRRLLRSSGGGGSSSPSPPAPPPAYTLIVTMHLNITVISDADMKDAMRVGVLPGDFKSFSAHMVKGGFTDPEIAGIVIGSLVATLCVCTYGGLILMECAKYIRGEPKNYIKVPIDPPR
jgi:hypothetical protein